MVSPSPGDIGAFAAAGITTIVGFLIRRWLFSWDKKWDEYKKGQDVRSSLVENNFAQRLTDHRESIEDKVDQSSADMIRAFAGTNNRIETMDARVIDQGNRLARVEGLIAPWLGEERRKSTPAQGSS